MTAQINFHGVQLLQEVKRALGIFQELLGVLEAGGRHPLKDVMDSNEGTYCCRFYHRSDQNLMN